MTIIDAIADSYRQMLTSVPYGDATLVTTPTAFTSGDMLTLHVTLSHDLATVTDRGQATGVLEDYGVDWTKGRARDSIAAIRRSIGLPPVFGSQDWELTASVDPADVAIAVQAIADAAMRVDGLQVLARTARASSFADLSVQRVASRAAVVPRAKMPGKYGEHRQVTLSYPGSDGDDYFVQALGSRDRDTRTAGHDHASGLFLNAAPTVSHRIALLQSGSWEDWQVKNLQTVCRVVDEADVDEFVQGTAA